MVTVLGLGAILAHTRSWTWSLIKARDSIPLPPSTGSIPVVCGFTCVTGTSLSVRDQSDSGCAGSWKRVACNWTNWFGGDHDCVSTRE